MYVDITVICTHRRFVVTDMTVREREREREREILWKEVYYWLSGVPSIAMLTMYTPGAEVAFTALTWSCMYILSIKVFL